ncbi:hypothetical protein CPter291_0842 [Collimonas pratensis]|uniref:Uncharacterized protein n=1 Tax=Collimonas pratensis TaxID=279113 RepID=A0ABN4M6E9_9BURK|nr:hypothetical protein CPter291_0842 [Collimonas pratensis]
MFTQIHDGAAENRIQHGGHCNKEMICQIQGGGIRVARRLRRALARGRIVRGCI